MLKTINLEQTQLAGYVGAQTARLFPVPDTSHFLLLEQWMPVALRRLKRCINEVKVWTPNQFDILHSTQYCIFLYYLANTIWKETGTKRAPTLLFLLNKALNGIDLFYEIDMPEVFFIGHTTGVVLAKATYGNHLILYQNSTVGKNHGVAPILGDHVTLYPNTAVIGRSHVKAGTVISQGVSVINRDTPGDCLVFSADGGKLTFKSKPFDFDENIFVN